MILSDKKGAVTVQTMVIVFGIMIVFSIAFQFIRVSIVASGVRDTMRNDVIDAVDANYNNAFDGMREGNSDAYSADNAWAECADSSSVVSGVVSFLGLTSNGSAYVKEDDGTTQYSISGIAVNLQNPPMGTDDIKLNIRATYTLSVPVSLFLIRLPQLSLPQSVNAGFQQKF